MTSNKTNDLLKTTAMSVVESSNNWRDFLETAAHNHKYSFVDQLLIFAQKPQAVACANMDVWNKKLGRVVKEGATPIYLADSSGAPESTSVIFDVSDTAGTPIYLWKVQPEMRELLSSLLCEHYGTRPDLSLSEVLDEIAMQSAETILPKVLGEVLTINSEISNDVLYNNSDSTPLNTLREILHASISYMLLSRCDLNPVENFDINRFNNIPHFNTAQAVSVLGASINNASKALLNEISLSVKTLEKTLNLREKSMFGKEENENESRDDRVRREIRTNEENLPEGAPRGTLHRNDDRGDTSESSIDNRPIGAEPPQPFDSADGRERERDGRTQSQGSDALGGNDEQHSQQGRGDSSEGDSVRIDTSSGSSTPDISEVADFESTVSQLLQFHKGLLLKTADDVVAFFGENENSDKRIEFLQNQIYSMGVYCETSLLDDTHAGFRALDEGLELWVGGQAYPSAEGKSVLSWSAVVDVIADLIDNGRYTTYGLFPSVEEQEASIEETKISFELSQSDIDEVLASGSGFQHGKYRIYEQFLRKQTPKENAEFLKNEYGLGGGSVIFSDGSRGSQNHDSKGISITKRGFSSHNPDVLLNWSKVQKRIGELIAADRYLSATEKAYYPTYRKEEEIRASRVAISREFSDIIGEYNDYMEEQGNNDALLNRYVLTSCADDFALGRKTTGVLRSEGDFVLTLMREALNEIISAETHLTERSEAMLAELNGPLALSLEADEDEIEETQEPEMEYRFSVGDNVHLGINEYTILSINADEVCLSDVSFPLFTQVISPDELSEKLKENPLNDRLLQVVEIEREAEEENIPASDVTTLPKEDNEEKAVSVDSENDTESLEKGNEPNERPRRRENNSLTMLFPEIPSSERHNFRIEDDMLGVGTPSERFENNIAAIRLLKELERESRLATEDEQAVLSKYVGWGGLADCFDERNSRFDELKGLLDEDEYVAARESTLTAFYTPPVVIRAMYNTLENMNFKRGNILEPSCGIGNFIGMLPDTLSDSKVYGVELDSISGRIARQLYQNSSIAVQGYEKTEVPDSFFDCAIGNVPFGTFKLNDKRYNKNNFLIHDYFFAKTLDKVRPGGVIAFVTSKGTLDKENPAVRKYIAQRAELLGAIRLPNNTFKGAAGTEVTSDIIFLQKRDRIVDVEPEWTQLGWLSDSETGELLTDPDGNPMEINAYFSEHPEMVLGEMKVVSGPFGPETACVPYADRELEVLLQDAIQNISGNIAAYDMDFDEAEVGDIPAIPDIRNFSFAEVDGKLYFRENSVMHPVNTNKTAEQRIKNLIEIRDLVRSLIDAQLNDYDDNEIKDIQANLNRAYDAFTAKYGLINSRGNSMAFGDDSSYYLLCSLEHLDKEGNLERKADMFTKRTIRPVRELLTADSSIDALAISIGEKARVDLEYMRELTGFSFEKITDDLKGLIFANPERHDENGVVLYEPADEYLSGNVKEKLRIAQVYAEENPDKYAVNVEALEKVQPEPLSASEISVRLGATWIPVDVYQEFMLHLLQPSHYYKDSIKVVYTPYTGHWDITNKNYDTWNVKVREEFGTRRVNAYRILEDTLNLKDVTVYDTVEDPDGKKRQVVNKNETTIAQQKQQAIKDAFADWVWQDADRRQRLVEIYNDKFNSTRLREFNGDHILFHGMNPEITLMKHQKDAIARVLYGGNTLLAHSVGAGKTYEMAAAAMESKRLGLCHKNMFVVPNHLTGQWASEFLRLYPSANILVATKKDFETKNRKKFCARIATGDYDAVIIGHSQFEKIPLSVERQEAILQAQLDEIVEGIIEAKEADDSHVTVKQLERSRKTIQARLDKLNDEDRKDNVVNFEELGVDRVFVDEAHYFKNLFLYTKMQNIAGISQTEAKKSSDMFMKTQYMDELTGNRGTVFATGTPVSNSMSEIYTMQRYLQHDALEEMGLQHFDSWASTFGETVTAVELAPEGTGYRAKTRFARFYNLPELMTMFKGIADIKTADELDLDVPDANYHNVSVEPSDEQRKIVAEFSDRAKKVRDGGVDPTEDNMLKITNDGRNLGLDQRCYDADLPDFEGSKVNACVNNIYDLWDKHKEDRLAQLVFSDLSTPRNDGSFSVYDDIKAKLIARGIPEKEIAFIHDAKTELQKEELFADVRAGNVRVLLGSTQKMGAGTNVQDKLIALHDLDCPWRPADLEQRSGRIIRQGNEQDEVEIFRYVTKDTFDAYMWQLVENKQKFISQIMTSKTPVRSAEDVDTTALSYAEIKALATGNPLIKEKMDLDIKVSKLKVLKSNFLSRKYAMEDSLIHEIPNKIRSAEVKIEGLSNDIELIGKSVGAEDNVIAPMTVKGVSYKDKDKANGALKDALKSFTESELKQIGEYRGFKILAAYDNVWKSKAVYLKGSITYKLGTYVDGAPGVGHIDSALNVTKLNESLNMEKQELENLHVQKVNAEELIKKPFAQEEELRQANERLNELNALLNNDTNEMEEEQSEHSSVIEGAGRATPDISADYTREQLDQINAAVKDGLAGEQLAALSDSNLPASHMHYMRIGFNNGLSVEEVSLYANPEFSTSQIAIIHDGLNVGQLSIEEVSVYAKPEFNDKQMLQLYLGYVCGLSIEQVKQYADSRLNSFQMAQIRYGFESGLTDEQMEVVIDYRIPGHQMEQMCERMIAGEEVKKPLGLAIEHAQEQTTESSRQTKETGDRWP